MVWSSLSGSDARLAVTVFGEPLGQPLMPALLGPAFERLLGEVGSEVGQGRGVRLERGRQSTTQAGHGQLFGIGLPVVGHRALARLRRLFQRTASVVQVADVFGPVTSASIRNWLG
nr:hypothetical protein [Halomonas sp. MMSF_3323]